MTAQRFTMLVGIDGSEASTRASRYAADLAWRLNAHVVAAHAVGLLDIWPEHPEDHRLRNSHTHVSELANGPWSLPFRQAGVEHEIVLRDGPPALALLDIADEWKVDLVVVGSRGTGNADLFALGSTATKLTQRSTRPVLVVPDLEASDDSQASSTA